MTHGICPLPRSIRRQRGKENVKKTKIHDFSKGFPEVFLICFLRFFPMVFECACVFFWDGGLNRTGMYLFEGWLSAAFFLSSLKTEKEKT